MDPPAFQQGQGIPVGFVDLGNLLHRHPPFPDGPGGSGRGVQGKTQITEFPGHVHHLHLVAVPDGEKHAALPLQPISGGQQPFVQRLVQGIRQPQHLAGGFHLGAEMGVDVRELFKGEDRHLHRHIGGRWVEPGAISQIPELLPQHAAGG